MVVPHVGDWSSGAKVYVRTGVYRKVMVKVLPTYSVQSFCLKSPLNRDVCAGLRWRSRQGLSFRLQMSPFVPNNSFGGVVYPTFVIYSYLVLALCVACSATKLSDKADQADVSGSWRWCGPRSA